MNMSEQEPFTGDLPLAKDHKVIQVKDSTIEEEREFSKQEIFGLIRQIAAAEKVDIRNLEILSETYDTQDRLIKLEVQASPVEATRLGWEEVTYVYIIKGAHK